MSPYSAPIFGPLAWIDVVLLGWFALTALSVAYIAWDVFRNTPENTVIKWAWVLTSLYMGPVALTLYVLADKEPRPGEHEAFIPRCGSRRSGRRFTAWREMPPA